MNRCPPLRANLLFSCVLRREACFATLKARNFRIILLFKREQKTYAAIFI